MHSEDLAKTFSEMRMKGLFKEILFILDTCEAFSMFDQITTPGIIMVGSADHNESAIADKIDGELNTFQADAFSWQTTLWLAASCGYVGGGTGIVLSVPNESVGLVIGRGGATIKAMEAQTGIKIQIAKECPPETPNHRPITLIGPAHTVEHARSLITAKARPARAHTRRVGSL